MVLIFLRYFLLINMGLASLVFSGQSFSAEKPDYALWTEILSQYVDEKGFVDYSSMVKNRTPLDQFVTQIETIGPSTMPSLFPDDNASLAYYINAYNAHVIQGVLNRGPETESVWKGLISGLNFFVRMDIVVDGKTTNLKKLEDKIVRARYNDPRIHAALNCASVSCPRLIREAYLPEILQQQLEQVNREFLISDQHVQVNAVAGKVNVSKIFDWYEKDFLQYEAGQGNKKGKKSARVIRYINRYRPQNAAIPEHFKLDYLDYDKGINSQ